MKSIHKRFSPEQVETIRNCFTDVKRASSIDDESSAVSSVKRATATVEKARSRRTWRLSLSFALIVAVFAISVMFVLPFSSVNADVVLAQIVSWTQETLRLQASGNSSDVIEGKEALLAANDDELFDLLVNNADILYIYSDEYARTSTTISESNGNTAISIVTKYSVGEGEVLVFQEHFTGGEWGAGTISSFDEHEDSEPLRLVVDDKFELCGFYGSNKGRVGGYWENEQIRVLFNNVDLEQFEDFVSSLVVD